MSFEGGTYTIVVDKHRNIISVTHNGKPMAKEGEQGIPVPGREGGEEHNIPIPIDLPAAPGFSGCICLAQNYDLPGGIDLWRMSKVF